MAGQTVKRHGHGSPVGVGRARQRSARQSGPVEIAGLVLTHEHLKHVEEPPMATGPSIPMDHGHPAPIGLDTPLGAVAAADVMSDLVWVQFPLTDDFHPANTGTRTAELLGCDSGLRPPSARDASH